MTLGDRIVVMSEGVVQQQGTPEELFQTPRNKFVAGFIGTPTMNFLEGILVRESDALWVRGDGFLLPLSAELSARIPDSTTAAVTVGIRPSAFSADPAVGAPIELSLIVSEYLGTLSVLVMRCGEAEVQVEFAGTAPRTPGHAMTFGVRPEDIMIFDNETGLNL